MTLLDSEGRILDKELSHELFSVKCSDRNSTPQYYLVVVTAMAIVTKH